MGGDDGLLSEAAHLHDVVLAEILVGRLRAEGIDARLFDAGFAGLLGGGQPGIRLMVPTRELGLAQAIIADPDG